MEGVEGILKESRQSGGQTDRWSSTQRQQAETKWKGCLWKGRADRHRQAGRQAAGFSAVTEIGPHGSALPVSPPWSSPGLGCPNGYPSPARLQLFHATMGSFPKFGWVF